MRSIYSFQVSDINLLRVNLVNWAKQFDYFILLDSNNDRIPIQGKNQYSDYDLLVGAGHISCSTIKKDAFGEIANFVQKTNDWCFGHLNYDLKSITHGSTSENIDYIGFQEYFFFQPQWVIVIKNNMASILFLENYTALSPEEISRVLQSKQKPVNKEKIKDEAFENISKETYIRNVELLKKHIHRGDIYEINYCINFLSNNIKIDPYCVYIQLNEYSPAPFATFYKNQDNILISASPERYLKKTGDLIISQPIKGTMQRGASLEEDHLLKLNLIDNPKERSENTMITDLVRNDLSVTARFGSVKVDEHCGLYTFKHVHQLISTVSCRLDKNYKWIDAIKYAFPMGSMTGAPKYNAIKLAEKYEDFKRGLYSGSVGYISPEKDFDFNVVIRSILYNTSTQKLIIPAGSAITAESDPDKEYQECILKAKALMDVLTGNNR